MSGSLLVDILMNYFVEDGLHEKEYVEARDRARAYLLRDMYSNKPGYDRHEVPGSSNDNFGAPSGEPLPYIPPTEQTEVGYVGMLPPLA